MASKDMNIALFKRLYVEQQKYRNWFMELSSEEKEKNAAEYAFNMGVVNTVERTDFSDSVCKALIDTPFPLKALYKYWEFWQGNMDALIIPVMEQFAEMNPGIAAIGVK